MLSSPMVCLFLGQHVAAEEIESANEVQHSKHGQDIKVGFSRFTKTVDVLYWL